MGELRTALRHPRSTHARAVLRGLRTIPHHHQIECIVVFVGHARSGSTLLGAALDAHPDVVLAHETNILGMLRRNVTRRTLYGALIERARWFRDVAGLQWQGYDYTIDRRWQGRFRALRVIGDKKGHLASALLLREPDLLDRLEALAGAPVLVVIPLRDPFANIDAILRHQRKVRDGATRQDVITDFVRRSDAIERVVHERGDAVLVSHAEDLVADPRAVARAMAAFVGVAPSRAWIDAIADAVRPPTPQASEGAAWTPEERAAVEVLIERCEHLRRYRGRGPTPPAGSAGELP